MTEKEKKKIQTDSKVGKIIDEMTLFDDDLMSMVFDANIPATELILNIILKRNDIKVISVVGQKELENPMVDGRNLRLDILAQEQTGKIFNVEVQRRNSGADERRARFHSSMIDSRMLKENQEFKNLRESYVILITQNDYFGYGLPIYTINRYIEELHTKFQDDSHILYVNGSYRGDNPIGKLMQDFSCKSANDMYYNELAKSMRHFKEGGGREYMCEAVEKYAQEKAKEAAKETAIKTTIEDAISYRMDKEVILNRLCEKYGVNKAEAEELYQNYAS